MAVNLKSVCYKSVIGQEIKLHTQKVYNNVYGAKTNPTPDEFIYIEDSGIILASFGITFRENRSLFSENYLDHPLNIMSHEKGHLVSCEVGSFISLRPGFGLQLYKLLPYILREKGVSHSLVTLTEKVQAIFYRLHYRIALLANAHEDRAPVRGIWGSFYKTNPKTYIFDVMKSCSDISLEDHAKRIDIVVDNCGRTLTPTLEPQFFDISNFKDYTCDPIFNPSFQHK